MPKKGLASICINVKHLKLIYVYMKYKYDP